MPEDKRGAISAEAVETSEPQLVPAPPSTSVRLLYWPLFRPGVLVGSPAQWFAARHDAIAALADRWGLAIAGLAIAGVAIAAARRRWTLLSLVPFQLALSATYALFFAEHGFAVEGVDGAAAGLDFAHREAAARGLRLGLHQADADALPFADESFDYVLSWNVIFHGTMGDVGRRLAEIWRILKPGALYQGTMLSKRDAQFGRGRPVAPDTFIRGSDAKAHPHYYCDLAGLAALFAGFDLLSLTQEEQRRPGSWHWHILAERC